MTISQNSYINDVVFEVNITGTVENKSESERVTNQIRNSVNSVSWDQTTIPLQERLARVGRDMSKNLISSRRILISPVF